MTARLRIIILFLIAMASYSLEAVTSTEGKRQGMAKVAPELLVLYEQYSAYLVSHKTGPFRPANPLVRVIDDRVAVDAVASGDVDALKSDLVSLGMQKAVSFGRLVSGQLPIASIPALANLTTLQFARAASAGKRGRAVTPSLQER